MEKGYGRNCDVIGEYLGCMLSHHITWVNPKHWMSSVRRADTTCARDNHDNDTSQHHNAHSIHWPATKSDKPPRKQARSAGLLPSKFNKFTASQKVHVFIDTTVPHAMRPHRICVPTLARSSYHVAWLSPVGVKNPLVCLCDDWSMPQPLIHTLLGGLRRSDAEQTFGGRNRRSKDKEKIFY